MTRCFGPKVDRSTNEPSSGKRHKSPSPRSIVTKDNTSSSNKDQYLPSMTQSDRSSSMIREQQRSRSLERNPPYGGGGSRRRTEQPESVIRPSDELYSIDLRKKKQPPNPKTTTTTKDIFRPKHEYSERSDRTHSRITTNNNNKTKNSSIPVGKISKSDEDIVYGKDDFFVGSTSSPTGRGMGAMGENSQGRTRTTKEEENKSKIQSHHHRHVSPTKRGIPGIEPAGSQEFVSSFSSKKRDPSARYASKGQLRIDVDALERQSSSGNGKKDPRRQRGQGGISGKENNYDEDEIDHLSEVPSDVDSVVKDRYLLACQMLKGAVTEKDKGLQPLEKEFILCLLGDIDDKTTIHDNSMMSMSGDRLAASKLNADALVQQQHQQEQGQRRKGLSCGTEGHSVASQTPYQGQDILTKHPHTATTRIRTNSPVLPSLFSVPCTPQHAAAAIVGNLKKNRNVNNNNTANTNTTNNSNLNLLQRIPRCGDENTVSDSMEESDSEDSGIQQNKDGGGGGRGRGTSKVRRFNGWDYYKPSDCPFRIFGHFNPQQPRVLTPTIMENLRGFVPLGASDSNFWLKYSLVRDGPSLSILLDSIHNSILTIIGIETDHGEVFGSFTASPWRRRTRWFGSNDAFLWRLKKSRFTSDRSPPASYESEMEVYPYTGSDHLIQYCTNKTIAVGGGEWVGRSCPFRGEPRGIGFMIDGDLLGGETNSCATFANPRLCKHISTSNEFTIANIEVWTLTPCLNVHDAANLEMEGIFWATTQASF